MAPVVVRYADFSGNSGQASGSAQCLSGEQAVGGGYYAGGNGLNGPPVVNAPVPGTDGDPATGWQVTILASGGSAFLTARVYVLCQQTGA
ncbi:hypothetical protein [Nocardioides panacisoli]|uniref:hypothetical protein n=1 Tax=Nocardioides panacisoli TaxID=627624 RepID=UPI0031D361A8